MEEHRLEADKEFEEEKRLLYVAITRACSTLVIGEGFYSAKRPWAKWVRAVVDRLAPGALQRAAAGEHTFTEDHVNASLSKKSIPIDVISASAFGDFVPLELPPKEVHVVDCSTSNAAVIIKSANSSIATTR